MSNELVCWKCGAAIADQPLPLGRAAECGTCRADLHVCRMCEFYDTRLAKHCREPIAEVVKDKDRSNFCGYFKARPGAHRPADHTQAQAARSQLDALFGANTGAASSPASGGAAREDLAKLFDLKKNE